MIERIYGKKLRDLLRRFPAVTILGPRQCGKTTFIRHELPDWSYLDLERPGDAVPFQADPEARFAQLGRRLVLDEAQSVPEIFPILRGMIDRRPNRPGGFVLLGSASPRLIRKIAESLAGRSAFLDLSPFRWGEVRNRRQSTPASLWLKGGFPKAFLASGDTERLEWQEAFVRTFIERDLTVLGIDISPPLMRRLWTMLAHVNGGLWNASQLAGSLGVSYHTINRYLDILEQAFLVRRLLPYHANIGKRLIKSPKIYFRDTGLLHYFLGIRTMAELDIHPARGLSWEAFVLDQLITAYGLADPAAHFWFWRTARGGETDLLIEAGPRLIPVEIKLHTAPSASEAAGLARSMSDLNLRRGYLIHAGDSDYSLGNGIIALPAGRLLADPLAIPDLLR